MALCDECINKEKCGVQEFFGEGKLLLSHCKNFTGEAPREIKTNFQRITASPEALAGLMLDCADCNLTRKDGRWVETMAECPVCDGDGEFTTDDDMYTCPKCGGSGRISTLRRVKWIKEMGGWHQRRLRS